MKILMYIWELGKWWDGIQEPWRGLFFVSMGFSTLILPFALHLSWFPISLLCWGITAMLRVLYLYCIRKVEAR